MMLYNQRCIRLRFLKGFLSVIFQITTKFILIYYDTLKFFMNFKLKYSTHNSIILWTRLNLWLHPLFPSAKTNPCENKFIKSEHCVHRDSGHSFHFFAFFAFDWCFLRLAKYVLTQNIFCLFCFCLPVQYFFSSFLFDF